MQRGKEISEQINILGDDGVPVDYHVTFWKSELIDFTILQQDAFDVIDAVTPMERQDFMLKRIINICRTEFKFENFTQVAEYFKTMINIFKQMNYAAFKSEKFYDFDNQIDVYVQEKTG
jgi:V/A-type H+-transporting ATPase subunit A